MERIYTKLVRDNIPSIIKAKGETPVTKILNDDAYKIELEKKLNEEKIFLGKVIEKQIAN